MAEGSRTACDWEKGGTGCGADGHQYVRRAAGLNDVLGKAKNARLRYLDLEITERCNNNCIHCYINRQADDEVAKERELDATVLTALLKEAAALGCLSIRFTGGEPLIREDFSRIYLAARRSGMRVGLVTNATRVTKEIADLLASVPPLGNVEVTIYGMTQQTYERVSRTPGSFEAAWRGIELLLAAGIPIQPRAFFPFQCDEEWHRLMDWMDTLPHRAQMPPAQGILYLRARRDSEARNRSIRELRRSPRACVDEMVNRTGSFEHESRCLLARLQRGKGRRLFSCGAGKGSACLDAYGTMQPCLLLRHPNLTHNVVSGRTTMKTVMEEAFSALEILEATSPSFLSRCARCFLRGFCEQCPGHSWMEHGTLDTPVEYLCAMAHEAATRLGLLGDGEKAWNVEDGGERLGRFVGEGMDRPMDQNDSWEHCGKRKE